jgi:hypothetical protein
MCLDSASLLGVKPLVGYKVMKYDDLSNTYIPAIQRGNGMIANRWYMCSNPDEMIEMENNRKRAFYESGFHIFKTLSGAKSHLAREYTYTSNAVVVKVEYRTVVATGKQYRIAVDVAQMMKIIGKV